MKSLIQHTKQWWFLAGLLFVGGCESLFPAPEVTQPSATITNAKPPKGPVFDPNDGVKHWEDPTSKLNAAGDPTKPDAFQVVDVISGDLLRVRGVDTVQAGKPPRETKVYSAPDVVRLAGIIVPDPGRPGWVDTVSKVREWTLNQEVTIERDPVFPADLARRPLVQVFFKPQTGKLKGTELNLNRMLVRLGLAVVDINSPTSLDVKPWLNDEQFARSHKDANDKMVSLGLWAKGIVLQQRIPAPTPIGAKVPVRRINVAPETIKGSKTVGIRRTSRITTSNATATAGRTTPGGGATAGGGAAGQAGATGAAPGAASSQGAPMPAGRANTGAYPGSAGSGSTATAPAGSGL